MASPIAGRDELDPDDAPLYCQSCGYDVSKCTSNVCPECGAGVDPEDALAVGLSPPHIPGIGATLLLQFARWTLVAVIVGIFVLGLITAVTLLIKELFGSGVWH